MSLTQTDMFVEDSSNVSNCFRIRYQALHSPIRRSSDLEGMSDTLGDPVLGEASWNQVCTVEADVFGFRYGKRILMRTAGIVRLRDDLMKLSKKLFM